MGDYYMKTLISGYLKTLYIGFNINEYTRDDVDAFLDGIEYATEDNKYLVFKNTIEAYDEDDAIEKCSKYISDRYIKAEGYYGNPEDGVFNEEIVRIKERFHDFSTNLNGKRKLEEQMMNEDIEREVNDIKTRFDSKLKELYKYINFDDHSSSEVSGVILNHGFGLGSYIDINTTDENEEICLPYEPLRYVDIPTLKDIKSNWNNALSKFIKALDEDGVKVNFNEGALLLMNYKELLQSNLFSDEYETLTSLINNIKRVGLKKKVETLESKYKVKKSKPEPKSEAKPEVKQPEPKSEAKPEVKQSKPEPKSEAKPEVKQPEPKHEPKQPEAKPEKQKHDKKGKKAEKVVIPEVKEFPIVNVLNMKTDEKTKEIMKITNMNYKLPESLKLKVEAYLKGGITMLEENNRESKIKYLEDKALRYFEAFSNSATGYEPTYMEKNIPMIKGLFSIIKVGLKGDEDNNQITNIVAQSILDTLETSPNETMLDAIIDMCKFLDSFITTERI